MSLPFLVLATCLFLPFQPNVPRYGQLSVYCTSDVYSRVYGSHTAFHIQHRDRATSSTEPLSNLLISSETCQNFQQLDSPVFAGSVQVCFTLLASLRLLCKGQP